MSAPDNVVPFRPRAIKADVEPLRPLSDIRASLEAVCERVERRAEIRARRELENRPRPLSEIKTDVAAIRANLAAIRRSLRGAEEHRDFGSE